MTSVPSDLSKFTVPQLKALCKEKRITGYSKLGKAALLQRLAEFGAPPKSTLPSNDQARPSPSAAPSPPPLLRAEKAQDAIISPAPSGSSAPRPQVSTTNVAQQTAQQEVSSTTDSLAVPETSAARSSSSASPCKSIQIQTVTTSIQKIPAVTNTKRPAHTETSAPQKRPRILKPTDTSRTHEQSIPRTATLQQKSSAVSSVFRVPELPPRLTTTDPSKFSGKLSTGNPRSQVGAKVPSRIPGSGRFKPLAVSRHKLVESDRTSRMPPESLSPSVVTKGNDVASAFDFPVMPVPELSYISHPPRASERKWVYRWAIILSALSPEDRQACRLVSRTFRYAVYLSAAHILSKNFAGRRLSAMLQQYPESMTNFWPYLRVRMAEVAESRQRFKQSFLGQYTSSLGYDPLSEHLWTSPDDEKQINIALRFVLTRMWFAISVGAYGHDSSTWTKSIIKDVREVVKGEIWQIVAQCDGVSEAFFVLEATCEVIGQPPASEGKATQGLPLRADWNAWILQRSQYPPPVDVASCTLLDCVKWSNTEDYDRGVSKAWLRRVSGQDAHSVAKRVVAERYILACVVANSISGQWMSTNVMAQDFAGLPEKGGLGSRTTTRSVNMYLPAHHHVEGIHFKTSQGEVLHPAIAVVQTPSREYYILRNNGMQVGCEEEGIPAIWQSILGCDVGGNAV